MQWSRYNLIFESKNNGWLLYNSGSNSFVQMDEETAKFVEQVIKDPNGNFSEKLDVLLKLRLGGFLVEDGKDEELFNIIKMRYLNSQFANNHLSLTIAPTRECNFECPYCYEKNRIASRISDETEEKIVDFIRKHNLIDRVNVTWYGGEPLLEFERIKSLTKKIEALGKKYSASITTNGYLLTSEIIAALDELKIKEIELTVDGTKETHDSRRCLIGGKPTYDVIISNIDNLLQSGWEGRLELPVNIDETNVEDFVKVYRFFESKYPDKFGKQVLVLPAFVYDYQHVNNDRYFDSKRKGEFLIKMVLKHGIKPFPIFPRQSRVRRGCIINSRNAYLVGPDGELYKCWDDLGEKSEVVGHVDNFTNWNTALIAEGAIGASHLENDACKKCFCLPICGGGCSKCRVYNKRDGGDRDYCSHFKHHAKEFLEIYYEQRKGEGA